MHSQLTLAGLANLNRGEKVVGVSDDGKEY
jgi:hypothetical protein